MLETVLKNKDHKEGRIAKLIENQTSKLPSDVFLWASLGVIGSAMVYKLLKKDHASLFMGQWVAPFLLLGVYNKLVKQQGHDKKEEV